MVAILTDTHPDALADSIQADLRAAWATYASGPGGELRDDDNISRVYTGLPIPIYNAVTHFRYEAHEAGPAIVETMSRFRAAGVPCSWWLGPQTLPSDMDARLRAYKPSHVGALPGMAMELKEPVSEREPRAGDTIEEVVDNAALLEYVTLDFVGFGLDPDLAANMAAVSQAAGFGPGTPWRHFTLRREGRMVANTSLFTGAGVAGLYGVATHPDARGQGLATTLVLHAMRFAQREGYRITTLQASAMGEPVYRKIGFRTYSQIRLYEWRLPYNT